MIYLSARQNFGTLNAMEASHAKFSSEDRSISRHRILYELNIENVDVNATDDGGKVLIPPDAESYFENFIIWTLVVMAVLLVVAVTLQFMNGRDFSFSRVQGDDVDNRRCRSELDRKTRENIDENDNEDHEINNPNYPDTMDDDSLHYGRRRPPETI